MKQNLLHQLQERMSSFSKGQRQIASYILEHYDRAAYMTASKLGAVVNVSESTVVRFADELGFSGYPELQRALQEMAKTHLTAAQRMEVADNLLGKDNILEKGPELLSGGSFTISNLGTMGIESFTPVINPPQTGILGVNTFETRIKLGKNGEIIPYTAMGLSLTYDHRALDGAPASRFLKELKEYLESFSLNLVVDSKGL